MTRRAPPRLSVVPFARVPLVALAMPGRVPRSTLASLAELAPLQAWEVESTAPVVRSGPAEATLLTLFRRRPGLSPSLFHHRWFEEHTPMAIAIHPVVGYVRNVVRSAHAGAAPWDGIVTEDFADAAHLASFGLLTQGLFGRGPQSLLHAARVGRHVSTFLDLRTLENHWVEEVALEPPR